MTPNPQASALARRAADEAVVTQARRAVAHAEKQLGNPTSPQARQLSSALQKALSQLDRAGTPIASLVALSDLSRQLAAMDNSSASSRAGGGSGRRGCRGHPGRGPGGSKRRPGPLEREPEREPPRACEPWPTNCPS